jgi:hypothetical protein
MCETIADPIGGIKMPRNRTSQTRSHKYAEQPQAAMAPGPAPDPKTLPRLDRAQAVAFLNQCGYPLSLTYFEKMCQPVTTHAFSTRTTWLASADTNGMTQR